MPSLSSRLSARFLMAVVATAGCILIPPSPARGDTCPSDEFEGVKARVCGGAIETMKSDEAAAQGAPAFTSSSSSGDRWVRHQLCEDWGRTQGWTAEPGVWSGDSLPDCTGANPAITPTVTCSDGAVPLDPWWVSRLLGDGSYGPWTLASSYQCGRDLLLAAVEREWRSMIIAPNTVTTSPGEGWVIADMGFIGMADTTPRTKNVTLLGTPVTIRAVATQYVWVSTDGNMWATADAGKPYDQGGTPFTFTPGDEHRTQVTLTTTWRGEYTTTGGTTWRDAPGTATTTSAPFSLHIYNPSVHRVDCDLDGNCLSGNAAPDHPATILDPDADGINNYTIPDNEIADYLKNRSHP